MSRFSFLPSSSNLVVDATVTSNGGMTYFPVTNVQELPVTKEARQDSISVYTQPGWSIDFDLGSALPVDTIAIVGHNIPSTGYTVTVTADNTFANVDNMTPSFTQVMTWRNLLMFKVLSASQSLRYWRVNVNPETVPSGWDYQAVGYVMLGVLTRPDFTFRYGWKSDINFINQEVSSPLGVPFIAALSRRQELSLQFGPLTATKIATLRTLYETLGGATKPMLLLPEVDGDDAFFGRWQGDLSETVHFRRSVPMSFIEDGYGKYR